MDYKSNIFIYIIFIYIHKSNDEELIDHTFKKYYLKFILIIKKIEIKKFIILIIAMKNISLIYIQNY